MKLSLKFSSNPILLPAMPPMTDIALPATSPATTFTSPSSVGSSSWRIAVPLCDSSLANPVTCAKRFAFYLASGVSGKVCLEDQLPAPENRPDLWPLWLTDKLVQAVVVPQINERLKSALEEAGIMVYAIAEPMKDPGELAEECFLQTATVGV